MESKYRYQLTKRAELDLEEIVSYIAMELSNPKATADFLKTMEKRSDEARCFPESGAPIENEFLPDPDVRKKPIGNYIMYYRANSDQRMISVVRIIYGKRNLDEILRVLERKEITT